MLVYNRAVRLYCTDFFLLVGVGGGGREPVKTVHGPWKARCLTVTIREIALVEILKPFTRLSGII